MTDFYQLNPDKQAECYQQLAETVLPDWGLQDATLSMIKMRENAVFKVESKEQGKLVLRIHRADYHSDDALRSELQWISALSEEGIETPAVIPTVNGDLFVKPASNLAGKPRQIDVFAWVDGEQLGSIEGGLEGDRETQRSNFNTIGALAARVHNHAGKWTAPPDFKRHAWDVDGLVGDEPFWGRFWELETLTSAQVELMLRTRDKLKDELSAFGQTSTNYSIIHADMVPENVLVDGSHIRLIDFDDAGYGWHLFDMATSLYFSNPEGSIDHLIAAYIEGYRTQRELSDEDLQTFPAFLMARATTYLGWAHTRKETETARELTPMIVSMACQKAEEYLSR